MLYEPHCDLDPEDARSVAPVDFAIVPVQSLYLASSLPLVQAEERVPSVLEATKAKMLVVLRLNTLKLTGLLPALFTYGNEEGAVVQKIRASGRPNFTVVVPELF